MPDVSAFDGAALIRALDAQRADHGLGWTALADELWKQSSDLNAELSDDSLCQGALVRTARRGTMSCQYAVIILRWIGRAPEEFTVGPVVDIGGTDLPVASPDRRLRWDLHELHAALDAKRRDEGLTWAAMAGALHYTPNRLTNLRTARSADMDLAMRVTQWIGQPAAAFIHPARW